MVLFHFVMFSSESLFYINTFRLILQKGNSQVFNRIFYLLFSSFLQSPHSQPFPNSDSKCDRLSEENKEMMDSRC